MPALDLDTQLDTDLSAERAHLAASRSALRRMRERAEALFATGDQVAGDAYAAETLGRTLARRVAELADDPTTPLFFGRLDFAESPDTDDRDPDTTDTSSTAHGSTQGSTAHGSTAHGSTAHGSTAHGSTAHGSTAHGSTAHGS
ncbi:AAA family ATPase, partial [Micromonospora sp. NPDC005215]